MTEDSCFRCRIDGEKAEITGYEGRDTRIEVPPRMEGCPVSSVARKAFLGRKDLYAITLPESVEEVGDWAFAGCTGLTEIVLPKKEMRFGRAVFKNCGKLKRIVVREYGQEEGVRGEENREEENQKEENRGEENRGEENRKEENRKEENRKEVNSEKAVPEEYGRKEKAAAGGREKGEPEETHWGEPELLAAAVILLGADYLLEPETAGSAEWLRKWDQKLSSILRTSDQEGYISHSVYGEEDYIGMDLEEYINERRKEKVRLAFLRLLHPRELAPALREELENLLRGFTRGRGGGETWQVLLGEHGDERAYYRLFAELACINEDNFDGILGEIGEDHTEMKAFFLKAWEENHTAEDFFQGLEL